MSIAEAIVGGLVANAKRDLAKARARDADRPVGTVALDIDFFTRAEADKPIDDGSMMLHGRLVTWTGARWAVWRYRWTGSEWRRVKRLSGPLLMSPALDRLGEEVTRTGLKRINEA